MDKEEAYKHARRPTGHAGREVVRLMNEGHAALTDWSLSLIPFTPGMTMLDAGCGGGRTLQRLLAASPGGTAYGLDYSQACVDESSELNRAAIVAGRLHVLLGNVSRMPFENEMFDLVTAVETFFFWPDIPRDFGEVHRVIKVGGLFAIISESYTDPRFTARNAEWERKAGYRNFSPGEIEVFVKEAGFTHVHKELLPDRNWITVIGWK